MPAEVGINSYVTVGDADQYFADRLYSELWTECLEKDAALISATAYLDSMCVWHGVKTDENQSLEFPRDVTDDVVPEGIVQAQMEIALEMISIGPSGVSASTSSSTAQLKQLKADVVTLSFFENNDSLAVPINTLVKNLLRGFGQCYYSDGNIQNIPLVR